MALPTRVTRSYDPMAIQREFDDALGRFFGGGQGEMSRNWAPYAVDVREDSDHIYIDAELPGFRKEEVDVTLENQTLTISAERREEQKEEKQGDYLLNERRYHRFLRSFTLPPTVDERQVDAKLHDGILNVVLNKREETKPRKITVA